MNDQRTVVWDGKDMAAIQMLLHDLRVQGEPAARWYLRLDGVTVLHLRMYPAAPMLLPVEPGTTIIRFGDDDHLATVLNS